MAGVPQGLAPPPCHRASGGPRPGADGQAERAGAGDRDGAAGRPRGWPQSPRTCRQGHPQARPPAAPRGTLCHPQVPPEEGPPAQVAEPEDDWSGIRVHPWHWAPACQQQHLQGPQDGGGLCSRSFQDILLPLPFLGLRWAVHYLPSQRRPVNVGEQPCCTRYHPRPRKPEVRRCCRA